MTISDDTNNVVQFLDEYSEGTLRKKKDLAVLLELAATNNNHKQINNLVFIGKSVYNLSQKLKKSSEHNDIIHKELLRNADDLKQVIAGIVPADTSEIAARFNVTYLSDTSGCFANLLDIAYDLAVMKDVQSKRSEILKQADNEL